jgi:hypothetical protein
LVGGPAGGGGGERREEVVGGFEVEGFDQTEALFDVLAPGGGVDEVGFLGVGDEQELLEGGEVEWA